MRSFWRNREFWVALALGAVGGATAALLLAPQSGKKTRRKIKHSLEDAAESLQQAGDYLKEQAEKLGGEAQKLFERGTAPIGSALGSALDAVSGTVNPAVNSTVNQAKELVQRLM